jgi:peptide/nickel transport system permease protein
MGTRISAALLILLAAAALLAPLWARGVAHTTPERTSASPDDTVTVDGRRRSVIDESGTPLGPTWGGRYLLGADADGRDVMVRLLYGARTSLLVGLAATLLTALLATALALVSGYLRGWVDTATGWALDVLWAFPVVLIGIALGVALALGGLRLGPLELTGSSLAIPVLVIALVYVPYMARPLRTRVLALGEREFVQAARVQGAGPLAVMGRELLPNLAPTVAVFLPLMLANAVLLEAALSYLGAGVDSSRASWGTMLNDGLERMTSAPHAWVAPGLMLLVAVLALNGLAEAGRRRLEPREQAPS